MLASSDRLVAVSDLFAVSFNVVKKSGPSSFSAWLLSKTGFFMLASSDRLVRESNLA